MGRHHHLMLWSFREYTGLSLPSPQSGIGTMFIHTELLIRLIKMILAGVDRYAPTRDSPFLLNK